MPYRKVGKNKYKRIGGKGKTYSYKQIVAIHFAKARRRRRKRH